MSKCNSNGGCQDKIKSIIDMLSGKLAEHNLTEIKFKNDNISLTLSKQQTVVAGAPAVSTTATSFPTTGGHVEKSPMVGVVYFAPEPGADVYIEVGSTVKKGDTICLIEAMKTFNPVKATKDGVVKEILVKSEDAVEFDTPLVVIG